MNPVFTAPVAAANPTTATPETAPAFSPLYRQIKERLVRSLQAQEWLPGQPIPSETELAARYRVSQGTVRKAIDELAAENLLVRRQGKGTFVATHAEQATQYRFLRLTSDDAVTAGVDTRVQRHMLDCRRMRAPADVARLLGLKLGEAAVQVRRLLLAPQGDTLVPVVLDDSWLPGTEFKGLTTERLMAWRGPLYRLFEAEFSVHMVRAEEKLRAVAASAEVASLLAVPEGAPLLSVERLAYTYGDRPMEFRRGLYHTAHHHYSNALS
jgi:GntR family transcriptional regulator